MTTASCKQKGRLLQQFIRDKLRKLGIKYGLQEGDITSTSMGASGVDVILSPAANGVFGRLAIECKNVEALNVTKTYLNHAAKYKTHIPLLIHKRNKTPVLVTLSWEDFELYFEEALDPILYGTVGKKQPAAA